ncbi:MAG: ORF6C domain-containing protein [Clostridiales bacterium]|nr:ORF6C domain-containing protein [Clostridiales bacterium]
MDLINQMQNIVANINIKEYEGKPVVSSREIAIDFEKNHKEVLRSIDNQIEVLGGAQNCAGLFIQTKYQHPQNKQWYKEYLLTRDGFSFIAMSFTGEKAAKWKLKYIEAFNKMEETIKENINPYDGMSKELQAIFSIDKKQQITDKKIAEVAEDLKDFKENAPLFNIECEELQKALRAKVISEMGGKKSAAYNDKSLRTKVFSDAQRQIKREFGLTSYKAIKRSQFNKALEIIENYKMPFVLREIIESANSQITMENLKLMKAKNELVKDYVV